MARRRRRRLDALQATIGAMLDGRPEDIELPRELCTREARDRRRRIDAQLIAAAQADTRLPRLTLER